MYDPRRWINLLKLYAMLIGYARISTDDQNLQPQLDALEAAGCDRVFQDQMSGVTAQRPGLEEAIEFARQGDLLVIWRLDRLGRSLKNLIQLVTELEDRGVGLKSLHESIDTSSSSGKLVFHMFGALAEFERNLIIERTNAGLSAARARGRVGGRPPALTKEEQKTVVAMYKSKQHTIKDICSMANISKPTLYKYLKSNNC